MTISFPLHPGHYTPNTTFGFAALVNGEVVNCEISQEALRDHFGAKSLEEQDLLEAFESGRERILEKAKARLTVDSGRRMLLVTADF